MKFAWMGRDAYLFPEAQMIPSALDRRNPRNRRRSENTMNDFWIVLLVVAVWFFLQAYLLPKLGVST
jgi:hypothetical protein